MATYLNPETLLPKNDFVASGPLGGTLAGLQTMYGLGNMQAGQRDQDLEYLGNLNKYDTAMKDVPLKDLEREAATRKSQTLIDLYDKGLIQKEAEADIDLKISNAEVMKQKIKAEELLQRANLVSEATAAMEEASKQGQLGADSAWGEWGPRLREAGVKVPQGPWDERSKQALQVNWSAAQQRLPEYRAIIKKAAELDARERMLINVESKKQEGRETIQDKRDATAKYIADTRAASAAANREGKMTAEQAAVAEIRSGNPDPVKMQRYVAIMTSKFRQEAGDKLLSVMNAAKKGGEGVSGKDVASVLGKDMDNQLYKDLNETGIFERVAKEANAGSKGIPASTPVESKFTGLGTEKAPNGKSHADNIAALKAKNPKASEKEIEDAYLDYLKKQGLSVNPQKQ